MVSRISRALFTSMRTFHSVLSNVLPVLAYKLDPAANCTDPDLLSAVRRHNIEGEYVKTSMTFLGEEEEDYIHISAYSNMGFKLFNGPRIFGPCAIFPKSVLHWNVDSVEDINEDSLTLFYILEPKIDILILGTGDNTQKFNYKLVKYLRSKGIGVEVLPTDQACATFNFLNAERRPVAAGLIPPTRISMDNEMRASSGQDFINTKFDLSDHSGPPPANELTPMLEESQKKLNSLLGRGNSESKQDQEHLKENAHKHKQTENYSNNKK